jgi:hypothetical protein
MERSISEKEKEMIINFGAFDYEALRCAAVLGWDEEEVKNLMTNKESDFYKSFQKGKARAEYIIDLTLFEQASSGDLKSLSVLEHRKKYRK